MSTEDAAKTPRRLATKSREPPERVPLRTAVSVRRLQRSCLVLDGQGQRTLTRRVTGTLDSEPRTESFVHGGLQILRGAVEVPAVALDLEHLLLLTTNVLLVGLQPQWERMGEGFASERAGSARGRDSRPSAVERMGGGIRVLSKREALATTQNPYALAD